jgi:dihydroflavonol-4-reductase
VVILPGGGIPIVDATVLAQAHRRALIAGGTSARFAVVGEYQSYPDLAHHTLALTGRPRITIVMPNWLESPLTNPIDWIAPLTRRWWPDFSRELVAGGFLRHHVSGAKANAIFGLTHPPTRDSIAASL